MKNKLTNVAIFSILIFAAFFGYHQVLTEKIGDNPPVYIPYPVPEYCEVEKPVYIERPVYLTEEKLVYVDRIVEVEKIVEVSSPNDMGYIPWESVGEIREYVRATGIPDREYINKIYDCENFALDLALQAYTDKRFIGVLGIYKYNIDGTVSHHWKNFTLKASDIWEIDPQTGNTWILQGFELARLD